jgi:hypothetical protein
MRIYKPLIVGWLLSIFMLYDSPAQNFKILKIDNMKLADYEYKLDKSRYSHKLSSELNQLYNLHKAGSNFHPFANRRNLKIVNDDVVVTLVPNLNYPINTIAKRLLDHSVTVEAQATHSMRCRIPINQLKNIAENVPGIKRIRSLIRPVYDAVSGEGIELMNADTWHTEGVDGTGVKIAVIDGGFDNLTEAQTNGDIPATYYGQDYTGSGLESETEHGTAVAEAVYEIVPSADYSFYHIGDLTDLELAKTD